MRATPKVRTKRQVRLGGVMLVALATALGVFALASTGPAGAQTSGGALATNGSTASGSAQASNGSTASGDAVARDGSTASGCSTAINNSTASGGECTTTTTRAATTTTTTGGTTTTTGPGSTTTTPTRLATTGSMASRLWQAAAGLLFLGLMLWALGLEGPTSAERRSLREPQA